VRVAFLGLGIMGHAMASNLVKAGHEVVTWNRSRGKEVAGARSAATPKEAAQMAEVIWLCVSDTAAAESVLFGNDGVAAGIRGGSTVVDSSTIAPSATVRFALEFQKHNVDLIDAPVTGSKVGARDATLTFMVGGKPEVIERLQPLFSAMGKSVVRMGDVGKGEAAKLAMNLQIAMIYEGFAEALTLASKLGVDQTAFFSLIKASMVRSGVVDYKMPFVEQRDFSPNFPLYLMHKDIRLALEAASENGVQLPGLKSVAAIYDRAHGAGRDRLDYAATLIDVEELAKG
jgi:3-hydroxyisobutyrate dehydrogenase-like beta-hydroxyacid dehydrogenase